MGTSNSERVHMSENHRPQENLNCPGCLTGNHPCVSDYGWLGFPFPPSSHDCCSPQAGWYQARRACHGQSTSCIPVHFALPSVVCARVYPARHRRMSCMYLHVGQAGNQIGQAFWSLAEEEFLVRDGGSAGVGRVTAASMREGLLPVRPGGLGMFHEDGSARCLAIDSEPKARHGFRGWHPVSSRTRTPCASISRATLPGNLMRHCTQWPASSAECSSASLFRGSAGTGPGTCMNLRARRIRVTTMSSPSSPSVSKRPRTSLSRPRAVYVEWISVAARSCPGVATSCR